MWHLVSEIVLVYCHSDDIVNNRCIHFESINDVLSEKPIMVSSMSVSKIVRANNCHIEF